MTAIYGKILLVDNDLLFLDSVQSEPHLLKSFPLVIKKTVSEALKLITKEKGSIRGIFISSHLVNDSFLSLMNELSKSDPAIPVIVIIHNSTHSFAETEKIASFKMQVEMPESYGDLLKYFKKITEEKWVTVEATPEEKNTEIEKEETDFIKTPLKEFVFTEKSMFNLYIRIGSKRFVKIVNVGDPVLNETLENFDRKGISEIYIPTSEYDHYIRMSRELSSSTLKSHKPTKKKMENLFVFGSSIANSLVQKGVSPKKLDTANELLNQSVGLIKNMRMRDQDILRYMELIDNKEHLSFVSFLACLIANEVGFESSKMVKLVGLSGLLHDIGLYALEPSIVDEEKALSDFPDAYLKHSKFGADLLRKSGNIEEAVCLAVEQHHMRRKGNEDNKNTNINLLTEVIGAADHIHNYLLKDGMDAEKIHYILNNDMKSFSTQIEKSVLKLFQK